MGVFFPIRHRVLLEILLLVYKSLNAKAPSYLSDLLTYRRSSYSLRSVSKGDLVEPSSKMRTSSMMIDRLQYVPLDCGTLCLFQYIGVRLLMFLKTF